MPSHHIYYLRRRLQTELHGAIGRPSDADVLFAIEKSGQEFPVRGS